VAPLQADHNHACAGDPEEPDTSVRTRSLPSGRPEAELAQQLLQRAITSSPTVHALALHVAAVIVAADDPIAAIEYNKRAVEFATASGAVLIQGFAFVALAALDAAADPVSGARSYVDVMDH
jgi:hypothetical protein